MILKLLCIFLFGPEVGLVIRAATPAYVYVYDKSSRNEIPTVSKVRETKSVL